MEFEKLKNIKYDKIGKIKKIELFLQCKKNLAPVSHKILCDADMRD